MNDVFTCGGKTLRTRQCRCGSANVLAPACCHEWEHGSPMTPEERAVIEAVLDYTDTASTASSVVARGTVTKLYESASALRKSREPKPRPRYVKDIMFIHTCWYHRWQVADLKAGRIVAQSLEESDAARIAEALNAQEPKP